MSLRTELGRVRGLGSAKGGTHHWWLQRVTAIALIPLTVWLVASFIALAGAEHETVTAWLAQPLVAILMVLTIVGVFYHLKLGVEVVIEDYIHNEGVKIAARIIVVFGCIVVGSASAFSVLKIAFQG